MENREIQQEIHQRILVLDGAMGTMIQQYQLQDSDFRGAATSALSDTAPELKGNNDLLSLTRPEIIRNIHKEFLEAGADIISTNTFNANGISQKDYGTESLVYDLNKSSAQIARAIALEYTQANPEKPRYVAGSMGPTSISLSLSPDVEDPGYRATTFIKMKEAYREQVCGLLDGAVDLLLVETVFDTLNAKAALFAIQDELSARNIRIPIMVSGTITEGSGRTLSGQTLEAFVISLSHIDLFSIGLNCSFGAESMAPYIRELAEKASCYISIYPNAGLPNQFGKYDEPAEEMISHLTELLRSGIVHIVGGCCGTTPEHIRGLCGVVQGIQPRPVKPRPPVTSLSGLEPLVFRDTTNFVNIGERCNVAGSRKFARLIREKKYEEALTIARKQVENGAQIIDINLDDGMLETEQEMVRFLNLMMAEPEIARLPIMVDSSHWDVLEAGLQCLQGRAIVNSISLKDGEALLLERARLIQRYGAATVIMAFDEQGQADNLDRRIEICRRAYTLLTEKIQFPPEAIIFDPNILTIGTGLEQHNNYGVDFIETVRWIKQNLPYAKTSGGVSNISFAFRGNSLVREAIHSVFLYHTIQAGLDMGIVNPGMLQIYDQIPADFLIYVEDLVLNRRADATERLLDYAQGLSQDSSVSVQEDAWRSLPLKQRLEHTLVKGIIEYLEEDLTEALTLYSPTLGIIEGPLMGGMERVGELFGSGKMFLPQVIKSARVMKKAVEFLLPHIEQEKESLGTLQQGRKKVLLATVKGDVHDIGKNIVAVVLGCNNYEVIDLGVMVSSEQILETAIAEDVDIIGLSGLITPSLEIMVQIAQELEKRGSQRPLLIGGATTSKVHTAVKISPICSFPVIHVKDASQSVPVVANLIASNRGYIQAVEAEYQDIAQNYGKRKTLPQVSLDQARANRLQLNRHHYSPVRPKSLGVTRIDNYPIGEIRPYIDWRFFFSIWDLQGSYPEICSHKDHGEVATQLYADAQELLDEIEAKHILQVRAVFGLWPAHSDGDDILLYEDESCTKEIGRLYHLRQEVKKEQGSPNLSLSDFVLPKQTGCVDYCGAFAVTAGIGIEPWLEKYRKEGDDYRALMLEALADRLAEAFTELLHMKVRREYWGYAKDEDLSPEDMIHTKYQGIRPAVGYSSLPDHHEKINLFKLLNARDIGMSLTEHYAMSPNASTCGEFYANPEARYFTITEISEQQMKDYARRKAVPLEQLEPFISSKLPYKEGGD